MRIKMQLVGDNFKAPTFYTMYLDRVLDRKELQNVTSQNAFKVGAAIARRRMAQQGVVAVPVEVSY
jgi:hypothetical protein